MGFPGDSVVRNLSAVGDVGFDPWVRRSLEDSNNLFNGSLQNLGQEGANEL